MRQYMFCVGFWPVFINENWTRQYVLSIGVINETVNIAGASAGPPGILLAGL